MDHRIPELSQFRRTEIETVKAFISRQFERFRPSYGRNDIVYPRQCVFAGSTNESQYLNDPTGNRRFWPVKCGVMNVAGLVGARDQLWAEATHRYQSGEEWHLTEADIIQTAAEAQKARMAEDPWDIAVEEHLRSVSETTVADCLELGLEKKIGDCSKADQMRVANILKRCGFEKHHTRGGKVWAKKV